MPDLRRASGRRSQAAVVGVLVFAIAGLFALWALSPTPTPESARGAIERIHLPAATFGRPVVTGDFVWQIAGTDLLRISMSTNEVTSVHVHGVPSWIAPDADSLWATVCTAAGGVGTCTRGAVDRLDPSNGRVLASFSAGQDPTRVLADGDTLWVVDNGGRGGILRIDATTGQIRQRILDGTCCAGRIPVDLSVSSGVLWVQEGNSAVLVRIDPAVPLQPRTIGGVTACDVVGDDTAVWVSSCGYPVAGEQTVWRVDPSTSVATSALTVTGNPRLGLGGGSVWVASYGPDQATVTVDQLAATTGAEIGDPIIVPADPSSTPVRGSLTGPIGPFITFASGFVWLVDSQYGELIRVGVG